MQRNPASPLLKEKLASRMFYGGLMVFFPVPFALLVLRSGYSRPARIAGVAWFAFGCLALYGVFTAPKPPQTATESSAFTANPPANPIPIAPVAPPKVVEAQTQPSPTASLDVPVDLARAEGIGKELKEIESSLNKYYGTKEQLRKLAEYSAWLDATSARYKQHGSTQVHRSQAAQFSALSRRAETLARKVFASSLEEELVKRGLDFNIRVSGNESQRLQIRYVLMAQPLIYKLQNDMKLPELAKEYGFTTVYYTNGFDGDMRKSWTVELR